MLMMVNLVNVLVLLVFMGDMAVSLPSIQQKEMNSLKPEVLDNGAQESQQTNKKVLTMARWPYWPWSYWFGLQTFQSFTGNQGSSLMGLEPRILVVAPTFLYLSNALVPGLDNGPQENRKVNNNFMTMVWWPYWFWLLPFQSFSASGDSSFMRLEPVTVTFVVAPVTLLLNPGLDNREKEMNKKVNQKYPLDCVETGAAHVGNNIPESFPNKDTEKKITFELCWEECQSEPDCMFWNWVEPSHSGSKPDRFHGSCYLKYKNVKFPRKIQGYIAASRNCRPVSAETAIVLGGFNQRYRIEMWEAEDIGVPPLPFEFSYGFTFFTENKEIIIGDEDDIYSWKRPGSSWTKHEEPPENINRANAVLTSDGETVLVIPNAAQLEFSYLFSTAKGWQDGEYEGEARLGACLVSLADKKEVVFIGGGKDRGSATDKVEALSETGRFIRDLPNLRKERMWHGCSKARYNGRDGILVVGGSSRDSAKARLDSVEFLADDETAWEALRDLPYGVWAGVLRSVGGVLHLFGGVVTSHYDSTDKVLQFTESGSWQEVGKLEKNASAHGVVVIN